MKYTERQMTREDVFNILNHYDLKTLRVLEEKFKEFLPHLEEKYKVKELLVDCLVEKEGHIGTISDAAFPLLASCLDRAAEHKGRGTNR